MKRLMKRKRRSAHEGAYWRGAQARRRGRPRSECPYNRLVGSVNAFRDAWLKGWEDAHGGSL